MFSNSVFQNCIIDALYDGFIVNIKITGVPDNIECACYLLESGKVISKSFYENNREHHFYIKDKKAKNLKIRVFFKDKEDNNKKISAIYEVNESTGLKYDFSNDRLDCDAYFIGHTRFSLFNPESNSWKLTSVDEKEYLDILYSDERLKVRFDIFINKALPLYDKMRKNYFYKHIVQYSFNMPEKWKSKLKEAASKYEFLILIEYDRTIRSLPILELVKGYDSKTLVYFRVDDDDLLSVNYLDALSKYSKPEYEGMIVSFGKGLIANYQNGVYTDFRDCHRRFLGLGMAMVGRFDAHRGSYWLPKSGNHEKVDLNSPTIIDSTEYTFIWTQHVTQDTRVGRKNPLNFNDRIMSKYRPIKDATHLKLLFPTLAKEFDNYIR